MKLSFVLVLLVAAVALAAVCDAGDHYYGHREPYHKPPYYGKPPYDHEPRPPHDRDVNSDQHVDVPNNYHGYEPKPGHGDPYERPPHGRYPPGEGSYHKPPYDDHHG